MEIIIKPKKRWWVLDLKEVWRFRDALVLFTWRDIKVKYKQTVIGVLWAVFQPFITMVVFSIFFGKLAGLPSDGIPYPIFVYSGLVFWTLFSTGLSAASDSFTGNSSVLTKVYFPRVILPLSSIFTSVVDFLFSGAILVVLMFYFQYTPSLVGILLLPVLLLMTIISSLGIGLFFASLNVKYRDVRFVLPFFIQLLIFVTPVIYPVSIVSEAHRWVLGLNPMAGVIDAVRASVLGTREVDWLLLGMSALSMSVYCVIGYFYFKKVEQFFADVI